MIKKKIKKHNQELANAEALIEYVCKNYKNNLDVMERFIDNAKMQQEMDIKTELRAFQGDEEEKKKIRSLVNFFADKYNKKSLFLDISKRYTNDL